MAHTRIYTPGVDGFVPPEIVEMLGEPRHHRQQRVFVAATSKQTAALYAQGAGIGVNASSMQPATGQDLDALQNADVFDGRQVIVLTKSGPGSPVIWINPDRVATVIGHYTLTGGYTSVAAVRDTEMVPITVTVQIRRSAGRYERYVAVPAKLWRGMTGAEREAYATQAAVDAILDSYATIEFRGPGLGDTPL